MVDEQGRSTPPAVTGAVSIGTAPLPFLAVYSVLFLLHGTVSPVHPPDITDSQNGELVAGLIVFVMFIVATTSLLWFLNRRRRWLWALVQLVVLAACIDVLIDSTRGGRGVAVLLILTTVVSLVFGYAPDGWTHVGRRCPRVLIGPYSKIGLRPSGQPHASQAPSVLPRSTPPTLVEPATLRRRRFPSRSPHEPEPAKRAQP